MIKYLKVHECFTHSNQYDTAVLVKPAAKSKEVANTFSNM